MKHLVDFVSSMGRWPLLLGAILLFSLAVWESTKPDLNSYVVGYGAAGIGSVMIGAWIWSLASDVERKHHRDERDHHEQRHDNGHNHP